jgi:signal transduction histidine kinase
MQIATRPTNANQLQRQSYLMAAAGHDLKQPLQVILMVMNRLAPRLGPSDQLYAEIAVAEIAHLGRGLNELAFASEFSKDMSNQLETVAIGDLIEQVAASWRFHAGVKGLTIRTIASDEVLFTNRNLITTVLRNLIGNAVKFTDRGGVLICCRRRNGVVRLEVWDSGPGIKEDQLPPIMQPFHQGDRAKGGLGLGLAIAQHAAGMLGGVIEVETRLGRGTRFALCLTVEAPPPKRNSPRGI